MMSGKKFSYMLVRKRVLKCLELFFTCSCYLFVYYFSMYGSYHHLMYVPNIAKTNKLLSYSHFLFSLCLM